MNKKTSFKTSRGINYLEIIAPYTKRWKWFLLSILLSLILAILNLRYSTPEYAIKGKIQVSPGQHASSEMTTFKDLEVFTGEKIKVEDEIEILNSRSNFIEVAKRLRLNVKITALGNILNTELYQNPPFKVNFMIPDSLLYNSKGFFILKILSETSFELTEYIEGKEMTPKQYAFGNSISSSFGEFVITPNIKQISSLVNREYQLSIQPINFVAQGYQQKIGISIINEYSSIVSLSLNDAVPLRAIEIIDALVDVYNRNGIEDKKSIADRTSDFIEDRITEISSELSSVDVATEEYKSSRGITDVASQSSVNLNIGASSRQELQSAQVQLNIASDMKSKIDNMLGYEVLPVNIGDGNITNSVTQYNNLVFDRNRMLRSSNEQNPIIVNLDQQLSGLKQSLQFSLAQLINNLVLKVNNLSGELSRINAQIYTAPEKERVLRDIARQQQTIESLFLYLLQKREESQITFANSSPKSNIIDRAYLASPTPVTPKKLIILLFSLILGFLVPFSFIYLNELLDNKVHNKLDLEKLVVGIPVLAELPKLGSREKTLLQTADRSVLAESLRILRANLDFSLKSRKQTSGGFLIMVTSSIPGEGKTFVASNLAMIYAKANKKVLLIGGDIRNPKIDQFYSGRNVDKLKRVSGNKENKGLTDYLFDDSLSLREITNTMLVSDQTMDIVHSGKLMPNPTELLMNERLEQLVDEAQDYYDYIIVDTAPMAVVSDTLLMTKFADLVLYVARAEVTNIKVLDFPLKLMEDGKMENLTFIVNGVKEGNLGYGGRNYGYGYGKATKKWWKFSA